MPTLDLDLIVSLGYLWIYEYFKNLICFVNRLSVLRNNDYFWILHVVKTQNTSRHYLIDGQNKV